MHYLFGPNHLILLSETMSTFVLLMWFHTYWMLASWWIFPICCAHAGCGTEREREIVRGNVVVLFEARRYYWWDYMCCSFDASRVTSLLVYFSILGGVMLLWISSELVLLLVLCALDITSSEILFCVSHLFWCCGAEIARFHRVDLNNVSDTDYLSWALNNLNPCGNVPKEIVSVWIEYLFYWC